LKNFQGTYCVMVTPFKGKEELDLDGYRSNIEFYIENGIHGLITGGSTGEFAALELDELRRVISTAVDQVAGRVPVLAGTGQCSTRQTIAVSKHAQDAGADGLLIVPPFYSKPSDEELLKHYASISKAVDIPIMVYNNPFTSKIDMKPELIEKLAGYQHIDYVKESSGDASRIAKIRMITEEKLTVFAGADNLTLESFLMGAKGWVSVTANVLPKECAQLYELAVVKRDMDRARDLYERILPFCNMLEDTGMFAALSKTGLDMLGKAGGKPRLPMLPPKRQQLEQLRSFLREFSPA
jgi:4-hydroxy-tetrahydrodipicolinate synthase